MIRIRFQAFKSPIVAMGLAAAMLAACGDGAPVTPEEHSKPDSAEAGYLAPPTVESNVIAAVLNTAAASGND